MANPILSDTAAANDHPAQKLPRGSSNSPGGAFEPIVAPGAAAPGTPMLKLAPLDFGPDRAMVAGTNPRTISNILSTQPAGVVVEDGNLSAEIYTFGQFLDHDMDLKQSGTGDISVAVPAGDPDLPAGTIIPLTRAAFDPMTGTEINLVSARLDLSQVYGSDESTASSLRNADGTLKTSDNGNAPPQVDGQFVSGDVRVMENPELVAMTTLFIQEHNRLVASLHAAHPGWDGDRLYNEARAVNIAEYQSTIFNQYLPAVLGSAAPKAPGFNAAVNPQISQEFAVSGFRFGHSQISNEQTHIDNQGNVLSTKSLATAFFNTSAQDIAEGIASLQRNLPNDDSQAVDTLAVNGLRNLLAAPPNAIDLIATDIQRERDAGVGTLNEVRTALGLTPYTSFAQITTDTTVTANLAAAFGTVGAVDLFMGGLAETHVNGGVVGSTFSAIIADQFSRLAAGDKFFYTNQFHGADLQTFQNTTLADIISRNTGTPYLQDNAFISAERHLSNVAGDDPEAPQLIIGIDVAGAAITGGPADDTLAAGNASGQVMTGGDGSDAFKFLFDNQAYTVADFVPGADRLAFLFGKTASHITQDAAGNAVVHHGGTTVTLLGVSQNALRPGSIDDNSHGV